MSCIACGNKHTVRITATEHHEHTDGDHIVAFYWCSYCTAMWGDEVPELI